MRGKSFTIIALVSSLFLGSCFAGGSRVDLLNQDTEDKKANACLEQILLAIKSKDKDALMKIFSKQALSEASDIGGSIDYLFTFFKGEVKSWKNDGWSSGAKIDEGKKAVMVRSWYTVNTDKNIYLFFIIDFTEDTINPDNAGLYTLRVIKAEDEKTEFTYWQDMQIAGIYHPFDKKSE